VGAGYVEPDGDGVLLDCWGAVPPGVTEGVVFVVSVVVVVVSPTTLPSLVCVVVVMVFFSLVPFWLSQPMVNTPGAAITTNARKRFVSIPFPGKLGGNLLPAGTAPARGSSPIG